MEAREISIFVDESGDPGTESKYYLVSLILHDQAIRIASQETAYGLALQQRGLSDIPLHLSPLMNGKDAYKTMNVEERKKRFATFFSFLQHLPFRYAIFAYKKDELDKDISGPNGAINRIRRDLALFLLDNLAYLQQFDKIKVYYDNGQELVTKALHDAIGYVLAKEAIIYKDASPEKYRFLQVADSVCTFELEALKRSKGEVSNTSLLFFGEKRRFEKDYLKKLRKKLMWTSMF